MGLLMREKAASPVFRLVLVSVFTALVFVSNMLAVVIPTPIGPTRVHLGNTLCLLSGMMLGPLSGGLAAGVGSMLYDFTNPLFIASSGTTLLNKFMLGMVCGLIAYKRREKYGFLLKITGATAGALTYVALYMGKSYLEARIVQLMSHDGALAALLVSKLPVSLINAGIAVALSVPLAMGLERSLGRRR